MVGVENFSACKLRNSVIRTKSAQVEAIFNVGNSFARKGKTTD